MKHVALAAARPWFRLWHATAMAGWYALPRPTGDRVVHARGANPDRLALVGNGPAMGYGVLSHDLALAGQLARQVAEMTARGVDVEVIAEIDMTAASAINALRGINLARFDGVVLTIGNNDAIRLTPAREWERSLSVVLEHIEATGSRDLQVFLLGIPEFVKLALFPRSITAVADPHSRRLNAITQRLCAERDNVTYLAFQPAPSNEPDRYRSASTYAQWARMIAGSIALRLVLTAPARADRTFDVHDEDERQRALERLRAGDTPSETRLDDIAVLAQKLFGTSAAAVTFLDGDRQRFRARVGITAREIDRATAFCDVTIRRRGHFVVHDASKDARFRSSDLVQGRSQVRFYAGYPIEDPDGVRVGALCIMDAQPRDFSPNSAALLRTLALMAQDALWGRSRSDQGAVG